ncbi:MAG: PAS domain-containing sensor histidine kinase, partial [Nitrospinales bacterium]
GFSPLVETNKIIFNSTGKRWFTFAWQASHELFAHTQKLFLWISSAGIFSILLIAIMGSLASDRIVKPIRQLQKAAARIGHGEDVEDLEITSEDEIGSLAKEINSMKAMLKKSFSGLENQVEEKTQEVLYLKEYTERVLMSVPDVIMIFSEDSKIEFVNAAFERLTHTKGESLIGKTIQETDLSFKDKWEKIDKDLILHSKQFTKPVETETEPSSQKYEARDPLQPSQPTKAPKQITDIVTIENTTFAYQFFDVFIKVGETRRTGVLMRDITKEQHLQDQLALAEKLSGLGRLAAGIAHEMNNPLYSIMGYTEAILGENDSSKVKRFAQKILDSSKHMASVILNLSGYVRTNQDEATDININERLDAAIELATVSSYSNDIELEKNYAKLPLFKAKPEEIQQIFINLIKNSVQAMDGKGKLTISSNQNNGLIVIKIQDTGPGIPLEYQNKIFDPFFTTKQQGEGTGLGLNIVHRLVEKYGGEINVESELGKGTTFIISFATSSA